MDAETLLAAIGLAACVVLLARMAIGQDRSARLDAALRRIGQHARARLRGRSSHSPKRNAHPPGKVHDHAEREARDLIDRARRGRPGVEREGNVYRPRSFDGGRPDDAPDGRQRRDH